MFHVHEDCLNLFSTIHKHGSMLGINVELLVKCIKLAMNKLFIMVILSKVKCSLLNT